MNRQRLILTAMLIAGLILMTGVFVWRHRLPSPEQQTAQLRTLRTSVEEAADYMVANQAANGSLNYQRYAVPVAEESGGLSTIRLIAGVGALYSACRVTGDMTYCESADRALKYDLRYVVQDEHITGACFVSPGNMCRLGGAGLAIDAIYKRWQVMGDDDLDGIDLMGIAEQLGEHIVWMRREEGGFYHQVDPLTGERDEDYYVRYFPGESMMGLLELYEMTEDAYWLEQAREVNDYMIEQPVTQDHWHAYGFYFFARLDQLTKADAAYAAQIQETIVRGQQQSLGAGYSTIAMATKVEALAALARAYQDEGLPHDYLMVELDEYVAIITGRQLPANQCGWDGPFENGLRGGIYALCDDPYIRVDAQQHWINGAVGYMEYLMERGVE